MTGLRAETAARDDRAYVTLATNADYAIGAAALLRSLRRTGTTADLVVMHTDVPGDALEPLRQLDARLVHVDLLPTSDAFNQAHAKRELHGAAPFTKGEKPPFHTPLDNFAKLRLWQLDYRRAVFIDADALALQNIDRLFDYPEFSAAPNVYESLNDFHRLNSGVFTARPAEATFKAMLDRLDQPGMFWRRTDQTFLESYFPNWHGLPVFDNMLQYVWINLPQLWRWQDIRVLHYQYEKPWQDHAKADQLRVLIDLWHSYARGDAVPDLAALPAPGEA
ncbi:Alpha-N-acetylglucosamine transferase [Paracoccus halophilus]|uniref:Alpha-N-acetylglucosamine transferase n=1 Tax=Paracoccus halophilus TaxID=376733 RepID=A0A099F5H4_9RHOB|nr:glycosyltransferase [Paracoccus halophilus]KGJ05704.1 glycosyl transferase [Paracoccus halophilus]SFA47979.1 Alpha-N-acetylglucosamine transferase [Paracoccus halophilus]